MSKWISPQRISSGFTFNEPKFNFIISKRENKIWNFELAKNKFSNIFSSNCYISAINFSIWKYASSGGILISIINLSILFKIKIIFKFFFLHYSIRLIISTSIPSITSITKIAISTMDRHSYKSSIKSEYPGVSNIFNPYVFALLSSNNRKQDFERRVILLSFSRIQKS